MMLVLGVAVLVHVACGSQLVPLVPRFLRPAVA